MEKNTKDEERERLKKKEQRDTIIALSIVTLLILLVPILLFLFGFMMFLALMSGMRFMNTGEIMDATWTAGYAFAGALFLWGFRKLIKWLKK